MPKSKVSLEESVKDNDCGTDSEEGKKNCPEEEWINCYIDPCTGERVKEVYTKTFECCDGKKYEVEKCVVTRQPPPQGSSGASPRGSCSKDITTSRRQKRCPPPPRRQVCRPPPKCCQPCCKPAPIHPRCPPPRGGCGGGCGGGSSRGGGCGGGCADPMTSSIAHLNSKLNTLDCTFRNVEEALHDAINCLGRIR